MYVEVTACQKTLQRKKIMSIREIKQGKKEKWQIRDDDDDDDDDDESQ